MGTLASLAFAALWPALAAQGGTLDRAEPAVYAYPNPVRVAAGAEVTLRFPPSRRASIAIYTLSGEPVAFLSAPVVQAEDGRATWDGRAGNGRLVVSGVYLFVVHGPRLFVGKLTVLNT